MFNAINFAFASETNQLPYPANTTVESAVIQAFLCPSDGQQRVDPTNWGATNYLSNSGTGTHQQRQLQHRRRRAVARRPLLQHQRDPLRPDHRWSQRHGRLQRDDHGQQHHDQSRAVARVDTRRQFALFNETTITNIPPSLFLLPNTFFRPV